MQHSSIDTKANKFSFFGIGAFDLRQDCANERWSNYYTVALFLINSLYKATRFAFCQFLNHFSFKSSKIAQLFKIVRFLFLVIPSYDKKLRRLDRRINLLMNSFLLNIYHCVEQKQLADLEKQIKVVKPVCIQKDNSPVCIQKDNSPVPSKARVCKMKRRKRTKVHSDYISNNAMLRWLLGIAFAGIAVIAILTGILASLLK